MIMARFGRQRAAPARSLVGEARRRRGVAFVVRSVS